MKKDWVLKQWIKDKLGIVNQGERMIEIGKGVTEGFIKGMEEVQRNRHKEEFEKFGKAVADGLEEGMKNPKPFPCEDCDGQGIIKYGDWYDDSMTCHKCSGTGKRLITIEIPGHLHRAMDVNAKRYAEQINAMHKEEVDKTDTLKDVHDVHIHDGKLVTEKSRNNHTVIDPLIESFTKTVWDQQEKVLAVGKYEHPIHKDNHTASEWLDHQMSEFADALVYRECLRQTLQDVAHLIYQAQDMNREQQNDKGYIVHAILGDAMDRLGKVK